MTETTGESKAAGGTEQPTTPAAPAATEAAPHKSIHEVRFTSYPKLLFVWPLILAGFVLWPFARPLTAAEMAHLAAPPPTAGQAQPEAVPTTQAAEAAAQARHPTSPWLGGLAWVYIWVIVIVLLTLGVDIERNMAVFWLVLVAAIWILGLWLRDTQGFTFFGDIYRWFASLGVQYDRNFGLAISIILLVPYLLMLGYARINDHWRITHNEFEHYSFGRMDDSLGRGAKTIRTSFPDVFELLLGLAGTLVVFNATGTKELRRIPHVMLLPLVRGKLNKILEKTAITAAQIEDSEEDDEDM